MNILPPDPNLAEWVKVIAPVVTFIISSTSLFLTIKLFYIKSDKEDKEASKKRQIDWFVKLILDRNLIHFHGYFDSLSEKAKYLNSPNLHDEEKQLIIEEMNSLAKNFRTNFVDALLAVSPTLYQNILDHSDLLIDHITNSAFDNGINLSHSPKFEEKILVPITQSKTQMLKFLFAYDGTEPNQSIMKQY